MPPLLPSSCRSTRSYQRMNRFGAGVRIMHHHLWKYNKNIQNNCGIIKIRWCIITKFLKTRGFNNTIFRKWKGKLNSDLRIMNRLFWKCANNWAWSGYAIWQTTNKKLLDGDLRTPFSRTVSQPLVLETDVCPRVISPLPVEFLTVL